MPVPELEHGPGQPISALEMGFFHSDAGLPMQPNGSGFAGWSLGIMTVMVLSRWAPKMRGSLKDRQLKSLPRLL